MDKQNQRLSILLADDEIGAYLQVAELTSGHIDDSNKDILCTAIKESNINQISQATGVVLEPYTIDSVKRAADSQKLESVCSALLPYLQMVNNKIASWQEQLERASNDEEKKRFEGYIESAARAQAATDQLQNAMDKALKGLPFEITFCGKLERALTTLSKGEKHHFDVVISDWRFQGSGSSLGGLLVLLAAELNKEDGAYIEKGFYTGYAGILTGSLDTRYIRDYVLKTHGFHELDKFQLEEGIKTLSENVAIGYITNKRRAPFITLERTEEALQSALSSSDKVGTAKKTTILLNEQDDYKMTLYHLFPFLFTDAQRGAAVDERRDKILDAIQQSKRQHGRGIVSGLYNRTKGFTHTDIQNKIIDEKVSFNARDCFAKWLEVTPIISSFCNRAKPSLTPMDCVKEELETKFNALGEALKSGSESIVCEKLLNLKKAMRLRFDVKPQVDITGCISPNLGVITKHHLDYAYIDNLFPQYSVQRQSSPQSFAWVEFRTLKEGVDILVGEINARGGGVQNIAVRQAVASGQKNAEVIIEQGNVDLTEVPQSADIAKAAKCLQLFCGIIVVGKFNDVTKGWRVGGSWIRNINELNITPSNSALWILRFPLR